MGPCFCVFAQVSEGAVGVSLANQTNKRHKLVQSLREGGPRGQRTSAEVRMFHPGKRQRHQACPTHNISGIKQ